MCQFCVVCGKIFWKFNKEPFILPMKTLENKQKNAVYLFSVTNHIEFLGLKIGFVFIGCVSLYLFSVFKTIAIIS